MIEIDEDHVVLVRVTTTDGLGVCIGQFIDGRAAAAFVRQAGLEIGESCTLEPLLTPVEYLQDRVVSDRVTTEPEGH